MKYIYLPVIEQRQLKYKRYSSSFSYFTKITKSHAKLVKYCKKPNWDN